MQLLPQYPRLQKDPFVNIGSGEFCKWVLSILQLYLPLFHNFPKNRGLEPHLHLLISGRGGCYLWLLKSIL